VLSWISPWEEAWLVVDRIKSAGRFETPRVAAKELEDLLRTSRLNAVAIAILCFETPDEGQRLANGVAGDAGCAPHDRTWLLWLVGSHLLGPPVSHEHSPPRFSPTTA
jgi:hypothetical protein